MAQPPLSQQIKSLEEEVGLQLFDRSSRKIRMTLAGRDFLIDARKVFGSLDSLQQKSKLRSQGSLGRISIGVIPSVITANFAAMLRSFQKDNPNIEISLMDHPSLQQIDSLRSGSLDVGFLRVSSFIPDSLDFHVIKREPMRLAVPHRHWMAQKKIVDWLDLANENLILVRPELAPDYYDEFYSLCRKVGFEPRIRQYANTVATQFWLISVGLGIAPISIMPEMVSRDDLSFVALPSDAPIFKTGMVWRRGDLTPSLNRFMEYVRKSGVNA